MNTTNVKTMNLLELWNYRNTNQLRVPELRELASADVKRQHEENIPLDDLLQIPCGKHSFTTYTKEFVEPFRVAILNALHRKAGHLVVTRYGDIDKMPVQQLADLQWKVPEGEDAPLCEVVIAWLNETNRPKDWAKDGAFTYQIGEHTKHASPYFIREFRAALKRAFWLRHVTDETAYGYVARVVQKEYLSLQELITMTVRLQRRSGTELHDQHLLEKALANDIGSNRPEIVSRDGQRTSHTMNYRNAYAQMLLSAVCKLDNPPRKS